MLSGGGCTVTLEARNLDIDELLATIERERVNTIAIVGDAFAKPMVRALDANPGQVRHLQPRAHLARRA